jgi:hypothetical protein
MTNDRPDALDQLREQNRVIAELLDQWEDDTRMFNG